MNTQIAIEVISLLVLRYDDIISSKILHYKIKIISIRIAFEGSSIQFSKFSIQGWHIVFTYNIIFVHNDLLLNSNSYIYLMTSEKQKFFKVDIHLYENRNGIKSKIEMLTIILSILTRSERMVELFVKFENKTTLTTFRTNKKREIFFIGKYVNNPLARQSFEVCDLQMAKFLESCTKLQVDSSTPPYIPLLLTTIMTIENPNAESPSTHKTLFPVLNLPASSLCLGKLFNNTALPMSIVFAPSLTIIQSNKYN
ncbi:hypothetical protein AGLY_008319 [Aphis glycines]|uniref:Uncharacterized protein n=1 Tax=Aphis glycines TaxID=307491 RepID=A0A6G0TM24_APHGL|nr:hypothetical protein AGLY_008319 [Aphis glycines]